MTTGLLRHFQHNYIFIVIACSLFLVLRMFAHSGPQNHVPGLPLAVSGVPYPKYEKWEGGGASVGSGELIQRTGGNGEPKTKKQYTKEEKISYIYSYVLNATNITGAYITFLNKTLRSPDLSLELDIEQLKTQGLSYPRRIPPELQLRYPSQMWSGVPLPVLTSSDAGRLGNKMGEYASLLALGKLYNVSAFIHPLMKSHLIGIFPNITLPDLPNNTVTWTSVSKVSGSYVNFSPLELAAAGLFGPHCFRNDDYPFEMHLFNAIRDEIVKEFKFADKYAQQARHFLSSVRNKEEQKWKREIVFVNVHIRRTDYVEQMKMFGATLPNITYFTNALSHYRSKFQSPVFIAASDDRAYLNATLGSEADVYLVPDVDGDATLAILSACNHSIITVGSYGFWAGYLTEGEVVYPNITYKITYPFDTEMYNYANLTLFHAL